jgi:hypothetical protein
VVLWVPKSTHVSPLQQPGEQADVEHLHVVPLLHSRPAPHVEQVAPFLPQNVEPDEVVRQISEGCSQQPPGHDAPSHTQLPLTQLCDVVDEHPWHDSPDLPQVDAF